jgi:hypothetical protein
MQWVARYWPKTIAAPTAKCPLLPPDLDQSCSGCGACGGRVIFDVWTTTLQQRERERETKNCFGLKSKVTFVTARIRPNFQRLWNMSRVGRVTYLKHHTAMNGDWMTKNCFSLKSKVPFVTTRIGPKLQWSRSMRSVYVLVFELPRCNE